MATWLDENVPRETVIGAFQSGALGYFLDRHRVVNLDGVVNASALEALKGEEMYAYLLKENISVVADWNWVVDISLRRNSKKKRARLKHIKDVCGGSIYEVRRPGRPYRLKIKQKKKKKDNVFKGDRF